MGSLPLPAGFVSKRAGSLNPEPSSLNPIANRSDCLFGLIRACVVHPKDDPQCHVFFLSPSPREFSGLVLLFVLHVGY